MVKLVNSNILILTFVQKHVFFLDQEMNILMLQKKGYERFFPFEFRY
jgi:hypothetical protein